jgi:N6-L-threonylcarbamoyladenine synthase
MTIILGIETSCDETGIAIYSATNGLLANIIHSQDLHNIYGGVVPELASRDHIKLISPLIYEALAAAKINLPQLSAIAYTAGPGLSGALLVGAGVASGLAFSLNIPTIHIHHLEGHLLSPLLSQPVLKFPFIALLVSGGHSQLILVSGIGNYQIIGDTLDDAAGEAFDKTAKMLDLPYPGGMHIAKLAEHGTDIYDFPRPMINSNDLNMSFSGLKTAVNLQIKKIAATVNDLSIETKQNLAKSIESAITDVLVAKAIKALKSYNIKQLVVAGGVSSNISLRQKLNSYSSYDFFYPPLNLCTDNGAMIAFAGYLRFKQATYNYAFNVRPRWPITQLNSAIA